MAKSQKQAPAKSAKNNVVEVESEYSEETTSLADSMGKKASVARGITVGAIFVAIVAVIFFMALSTPATKQKEEIWDAGMVQGDPEAKNHFVMYTDIVCPYCDYFSRAVMDAQDEFEAYLAENDIKFEVRVTDFLYEYNGASKHSTLSAEGAYCANNEGKFWDYYHAALTALNDDFHSKGIGNSKTAPTPDISDDYWMNIGHEIGLGDDFDKCLEDHETLAKIQENTEQSARDLQKYNLGGMPSFKFNDSTFSGFDPSWTWTEIKSLFDTALNKKS